MNIREYLKKSKLIADGSFGTYYSQKYKTVDIPEYANIREYRKFIPSI